MLVRLACIMLLALQGYNLRLSVLQLYCTHNDYSSLLVWRTIGKSLLDGQALDMQQFGLRIRVAFSGPELPSTGGKGSYIDCTDPETLSI